MKHNREPTPNEARFIYVCAECKVNKQVRSKYGTYEYMIKLHMTIVSRKV